MVNVVLVTYGDRWKYLDQVVETLAGLPEIKRIVLIDNICSYDLKSKIAPFDSKIILIQPGKNLGSAGGFKSGLQYILENCTEKFVWLLDDDNLPDLKALNILIDQYQKILSLEPEGLFALSCLRPDRSYLQAIADGEPIDMFLPVKNSFFGFHLLKLSKKILRKLKLIKRIKRDNIIKLPFAPYGGLFFSTKLLTIIGLPDERYYLYADDFEFTNRVSAKGGSVFLVKNAIVTDLEKSWINNKSSMIKSRLLEQNNFKSYFSVRNTTHFQTHFRTTQHWLYRLNKTIYLTYLFFVALISGKSAEFKMLLQAIQDGENGIFDNDRYLKSGPK